MRNMPYVMAVSWQHMANQNEFVLECIIYLPRRVFVKWAWKSLEAVNQ